MTNMILFIVTLWLTLSFEQCVSKDFHSPFEAFLAMISCLVSQREQAGSGSAEQ